jgi:phage-related protein
MHLLRKLQKAPTEDSVLAKKRYKNLGETL